MAERPPLVRVAAALRDLAAALEALEVPVAAQPPATPRPSTRDRLARVKTTEIARRQASGPGSGPSPAEQLLRLAAAGRDVPWDLLEQVATEASDLPGTERDVALVLSGDDRALAAAIRLARIRPP